MSKNKTLEALNEEQKKELKDVIEKVFEQALLEKGESRHILEKIIEDKAEFLKMFNPWQNKVGKKLIQKFVNTINNLDSNKEFSWLDILDDDKQWKKTWEKPNEEEKIKNKVKDKSKHVNMRYQIPTHFHGDIDNAVLFHCMENPRGYLWSYGDNQIDGGLRETDLNGYYDKTYKLLTEDNSKRKTIKKIKSVLKNSSKSKPIQEIIQERYQLDENTNKDISKDQIEKIIYSNHESALGREIEHMYKIDETKEFCNFDFENKGELSKTVLLKDYYYLKEYYSQLIQTNQKLNFKKLKNVKSKVTNIANKICNLEIYPFSCAAPDLGDEGVGEKIILHSCLSRLGTYIILRRIYMFLNKEDHTEKPIFVFRKYDKAWKKLFKNMFSEVNIEGFNTEEVMKLLEENFFYCQLRPMGGGITSGNVISVSDYKEYLKLKKDSTLTKLELNEIYLKMKDNAFKEISSILPRIEVDKKQKNRC